MTQLGIPSVKTTYLYASQLGLALNCDLMTGLDKTTGLAAADDGPAINAAMAGATADNPICLMMDGSSCVSGLMLPAGGHWSIQGFGHDTGFFAAAGANNHVIHNGTSNIDNVNGAAPSRGANVSIRDIFINGNRGNGTNGNSTTGDPRGSTTVGWYTGIKMESLDHVILEGIRCYNIPAFNTEIVNCGDWIVDKCHFENVLPTEEVVGDNSDGVHVDGPSNDGRISNCYFRTGDDPIALNACEGYGGLITRISISNCFGYQCWTAGRIYTNSQPAGAGAQALVDGVTWTDCNFTTTRAGYYIGNGSGTTPENDTITNVTFRNCLIYDNYFASLSDSIGTMTFDSCTLYGPGEYMFCTNGNAPQVSFLNIVNCLVVRTPSINGINALLGTDSAVVWKRVVVRGFSVVDIDGYSGSAIAGLLDLADGSTIASLHIEAVDATNIASLSGSGTAPTSVAGAGVLQTGWTLADSIMANNTLYLSSNDSGAPSIVVGGTAKRLTLA